MHQKYFTSVFSRWTAEKPAVMREVRPLDGATAEAFPNNHVINSRYTLWTFLPLNLFEQFRKPLNFYFLLVAMLQFISVIAPVNPLSTLLPLLFAFSLTAAKEGYDDIKRHRQDSLYNNKQYVALDSETKAWHPVRSSQIRVGDVIKVRRDEEFPCDVVVIGAPLSAEGTVYIRTDNLDGELDLKPRNVVRVYVDPRAQEEGDMIWNTPEGPCLTSAVSSETLISSLQSFRVKCPPPTAVLDSFDAHAHQDVPAVGSESSYGSTISSLAAMDFVPQSCFLKHVDEAVCIAVYTGDDTKCGMNKHNQPQVKWAKIDQAVSKFAKVIFVCQLISAVVMGLVGHSMNADTEADGLWYLASSANSSGALFLIYQLRFFLLTTVMIPVSFKFVVDLSKQMMALVLEWDLAMYNDDLGGGMKVRNSSIVEDLGQVEYIMSDKTGTMTQNIMTLKGICTTGEILMLPGAGSDDASGALSPDFEDFLMCALLCNAVEVEAPPTSATNGCPAYQSPSPDEEAICYGLYPFGYTIISRTKTEIVISARGVEKKFRLLRVFPFSSEKKCMGVLVEPLLHQHLHDTAKPTQPMLYVKGADDQIFSFARQPDQYRKKRREDEDERKSKEQKGEEHIQKLGVALDEFANHGLRTLVFASRMLSAEEYKTFDVEFSEALIQMESRKQKCDVLQQALFNGLDVLGVTAIEDKLQDDVRSSIETLLEANVRVWMLTGDKMETAEQIGMTCGLLSSNDVVVRISEPTSTSAGRNWKETLQQASAIYCGGAELPPARTRSRPPLRHLDEGAAKLSTGNESDSDGSRDGLMAKSVEANHLRSQNSISNELPSFVLIVQGGSTLDAVLGNVDLEKQFTKLALRAKSVICARVTPIQKAQVTKLVSGCGYTTLAIGDGGNDVCMIQHAHVGVGICGKEGTQASRAADFSISKFSHLRSLLLYHGHASYARTAYVVQYSFYKSMLISFIQLVFNVFSTHMSGASFWNSFALTMWNGVYTLPQTLCYCLDRAAPRQVLERHPFLYRHSQRSGDFNPKTFFGFVLRGVVQSAGLFWLVTQCTGNTYSLPQTGFTGSIDISFTLAYSALVLHQVATVVIESNSLTIVNLVVIFGMPVFYYITIFVYSSIPKFAYYGVFAKTDNIQGFLVAFVIAGALFLPHLAIAGFRAWWCPNPRVSMTQAKFGTSRFPQAMLSAYVHPKDRPSAWRQKFCCGSSECWSAEPESLFCASGQNEHSPLRVV